MLSHMDGGTAGARGREVGWLGATLGALLLALLLEHYVIHEQMILPWIAVSPEVPPWMLGAQVVPEIIVCFLFGWRLRGLGWIVIYGAAAAAMRQSFYAFLTRIAASGHPETLFGPPSEFARTAPLVAVMYFLAFGLASMGAREPGPLPGARSRP